MKKLLLVPVLALSLVLIGCSGPYGVAAKAGGDVAAAIGQTVSTTQQLQTAGVVTVNEARAIGQWSDAVTTLNGTYLSCVVSAHTANSKAVGYLNCANAFAATLSSPTLQAEIHVSNTTSQQKLDTYTLAVQTGVQGAITILTNLSAQGEINMDPNAIAQLALIVLNGALSLIAEIRGQGGLTDDQILAAAQTQNASNASAIKAWLPVFRLLRANAVTEILISVSIFLQAVTLYFVLKILRGEKHMSAEFDALVAQVAQQTTVEQSAITLIQGLSAKVTALGDAPTPDQLNALTSSLNASATALAAAVTANTPAQPAS